MNLIEARKNTLASRIMNAQESEKPVPSEGSAPADLKAEETPAEDKPTEIKNY